ILNMLNIPFRVIMPNVDESFATKLGLEADEIPEYLAREKVLSVVRSLPQEQEIPWVLGADTVISLDGKIYGKPGDADEAEQFLRDFSGRTHQVITALVLYNGRKKSFSSSLCKTDVTFSPMTQEEVQWYVETGEWHGAAGGYRIQSLASCFISRIEGSQSCVTGLPICGLYDILKAQGYSILE
ncbi:MAG: Maf family protein, partial [Treponemataceae bacterium]|nr:Maf family protein [Treponemataceae bacterium]